LPQFALPDAVMSALPQKADIAQRDYHVRFVVCPFTTVSTFLIL
jgi:hypothetical protein